MTEQSRFIGAAGEFYPHPPVSFEDLVQDSALKHFFSSILHELQQPLVAIRLFAENGRAMCGEDASSADRLRALFEDVGRSAELTIRTIGRLRGFVKGQAPGIGPTDVNEAVSEILRLAEIVASSRGVSIVKRLESGLAPIWADFGALQEAFLNLVFNAIEAIDHEDERTISVCTRSAGDAIEVVVSDTGCGIPVEHQDRLFDREFTTKPQGSGLGLGIARDIIVHHGGSISLLQSNAGEGTSFCVRLPTKLSSASLEAQSCSREQAHDVLVNRCLA
jgi:two-component system sensor histidine kinase AtoS